MGYRKLQLSNNAYLKIIIISFICIAFFRIGLTWFNIIYPYLFGVYFLFSIYYFFSFKIYNAYRAFIPLLLIIAFFIVQGFPYIDGINGYVTGELLKVLEVSIFLTFLLAYINRNQKNIHKRDIHALIKVLYIFPLIFAIMGLFKLGFRFFSNDFNLLDIINLNYFGSMTTSDGNIYSLTLIYGLISILYILYYRKYKRKNKYLVFFILISLGVLFSGSRRGFTVLMFLYIFLIFCILTNSNLSNSLKKYGIVTILSVVIFSFGFYSAYNITKGITKLKVVNKFTNSNYTNTRIGSIIYDYSTIFGNELTYQDFINKTWNYDKKLEFTINWSKKKEAHFLPFIGKKTEILPDSSFGVKIDSSFKGALVNGNYYSFFKVGKSLFYPGDSCSASVFCYVSDDYNGNNVILKSNGVLTNKKNIKNSNYNLNEKGKWKKLELNLSANEEGKGWVTFYILLTEQASFNELDGYVIFANPRFIIKRKMNDSILLRKKNEGLNYSSFLPILQRWNSFNFSNLINGRLQRWIYAWQIFQNYTISQKLIGNGFEYLELYNEKFYPNKDKIDYPHNPIISSFLYSGIIGGLVYIWFLLTSLYYYYKYRKEFGLLFILYLVTGFFIFFSYNSHFSIPAFSMLSVVPFVINYYKKEIENNDRTAKYSYNR